MLNFRNILKILGVLTLGEAFTMLFPLIISLIYQENDSLGFLYAILSAASFGGLLVFLGRKAHQKMGKREGFVVVSFVWIIFSMFGALPFVLSGGIPSFTDAFFETMSGFTTTGSSILNNIEELPHGLLFWRSMTQWLGGMGIIVLSIAILPMLGVGGMQLFVAEVPGPTPDKLSPKLRETARKLWGLYLLFTIIETILLLCGGMSLFDAVCHSFTTMATGGYSTKQASVAYWDSAYIQYVICLFMFIAGTNFTVSYYVITRKFDKVISNEEFRWYSLFTIVFTLVIAVGVYFSSEIGVELAFRDSLFQVISVITTTGYATADYLLWHPVLIMIIFSLFFFGGSAGSTGGGIKIVRILMLIKNGLFELRRLIHPNAVIPVRYNKRAVSDENMLNILAFFMIYIFIFGLGVIIFMFVESDIPTAIGAVATSLGNIGPGLGKVGPADNFSAVSDFGKWFLSFLMLIGRLELFTVLILFTPSFWKS